MTGEAYSDNFFGTSSNWVNLYQNAFGLAPGGEPPSYVAAQSSAAGQVLVRCEMCFVCVWFCVCLVLCDTVTKTRSRLIVLLFCRCLHRRCKQLPHSINRMLQLLFVDWYAGCYALLLFSGLRV